MPDRVTAGVERTPRASNLDPDIVPLRSPFSSPRRWRALATALVMGALAPSANAAPPFEDSMAQRVLACTGCHGPQGRGSPPNPGSLKGYIPSWDGADYPDLVEPSMDLVTPGRVVLRACRPVTSLDHSGPGRPRN